MMKHEEAIAMLAAEKYVLGEMKAEERESFEEHYFTCPDCARDVEELDLLSRGTKVLGAGLPERAPSFAEKLARWWARPQMGLAAASAMLALVTLAGYQSLELRRGVAGEAEALSSQILRPETRGEIPVVELRGRQTLVEMDLPGASGSLQWTLGEVEGKRIAGGVASAPAAGQTLKLLLPSVALLGSSQFLVEIRGVNGGESYRFRFSTRKN